MIEDKLEAAKKNCDHCNYRKTAQDCEPCLSCIAGGVDGFKQAPAVVEDYECGLCVNRGSPLCDSCTSVKAPSGRKSKPTYFMGFEETVLPTKSDKQVIATILCDLLIAGAKIPLGLCFKYNEICDSEPKAGGAEGAVE